MPFFKKYQRITEAEKQIPPPEEAVWTSGACLALAQQHCTFCYGLGRRPGRNGHSLPCNCVLRAIFRACHDRFRRCVDKAKHISRVSLETCGQRSKGKQSWAMKNEEFSADFCLVARRVLDDYDYRIFKYHFLLGADFRLCCRKIGIDRGTFFHEVYRIEQKLGRAFAEIEPHALFPTDAYFGSTPGRKARETPAEEPERKQKPLLRFPVRRAALKAMAA